MSNEFEPSVDQWYLHPGSKEMFRVVAVDSGMIEIQNFEGDVAELDLEAWRDLDLELAEPPENWTGPYDNVEADEIDDTRSAMRRHNGRALAQVEPEFREDEVRQGATEDEGERADVDLRAESGMLELRSPAFAEGSTIPKRYSRDGENLSPPLQWSGAPRETRSFALICEDPDAPSGTFRHWAVANIDAGRTELPEGAGKQPNGCVFARNDFGHAAYDGPAPPSGHGKHHYHFRLAALDVERFDVPPDADAEQLWSAVQPHVVAEAVTIGTYQRA